MHWIRSAVFLMPIVVSALIAAAFLSTEQRHLTRKNQLVFGLTEEPAGLNPLISSGAASEKIMRYLYNPLISYDENLELKGELAKNWSRGETATFYFGNNVQSEAAKNAVDEIKDQFEALHITSVTLEDNALIAQFDTPGGEGPVTIYETVDSDLLDPLHQIRVSLKQPTARISFADFQDKTINWGQIKRIWYESESVYEVTVAGDAEHFVKACRNYYASNAFLEARVELLHRQNFLTEPYIEFTLRDDVQWHDGAPFSSHDVVFTWESVMSGKWVSSKRADFSRIHKIRTINEHQIRVTYREPYSMILEMWADVHLVPWHLLHGKDSIWWNKNFNHSPIGTGPFRFAEWYPGHSLTLDQNVHYFEGRPHLDAIAFRFISDPLSLRLAFETGQIDIWKTENNPVTETPRENFRVLNSPPTSYSYLGWNLRKPLFQSAKVRTALAHAVNVDYIITSLVDGNGQKAGRIYHPGMWFAGKQPEAIPFNREQALVLLAEEGWHRAKNGVLEKDGEPFTFTLLTNYENDLRKDITTLIKADLEAIGIQVDIQRLSWNVFVSEKIDRLDFVAYLLGWVLSKDWSVGRRLFHSSQTDPGESNIVGFQNTEADTIISRLERTYDRAAITTACEQLQDIVYREQPYLFLYVQPETHVIRKDRFAVRRPLPNNEWLEEPIRETQAGIEHHAHWWYQTDKSK